jgi:GAF domain-containing protein
MARGKAHKPGGTEGVRPGAPAALSVQAVAELAWSGQHEQALARAAEALADTEPRLAPMERLTLHDLRVESLIALARLDDAAAEAAVLQSLVTATSAAAGQALAHDALARVQIRQGRLAEAFGDAGRAVAAARKAGEPALLARCLRGLGEVQFRARRDDSGSAAAQEALALAEAAGDVAGQGRAEWVLAAAQSNRGQAAAALEHAVQAAELARQAGDWLGLGNASVIWSNGSVDIGDNLRLLQEADQAFERAGYLERRAVARANLANQYIALGLFRRARRELESVYEFAHRIGARALVGTQTGNLCSVLIEIGELAAARRAWQEAAAASAGRESHFVRGFLAGLAGELALAEGDMSAALRHQRTALRAAANEALVGQRMGVLGSLAEVLLRLDQPAAALRSSARATRLHRKLGMGFADGTNAHYAWWQHHRALAANGRADEAWAALQQAHALMIDGVRGVRDAGLRRSFLNKDRIGRALLRAWLAESLRRGLPEHERLAHLQMESHVGEPFRRLVDTGMRLNEQRSPAELQDFLIDEVTELSGAERVLLVLESVQGLEVAGALLPREETRPGAPEALLQAVTPWLAEARRTRAVALRHGPQGAAPEDQRSCLIAPLVAGRQVLGYLYADIEGAFGRFDNSDGDLLGLLAAQAAVALENARWGESLEAKVAERTAEARAAQAQAEQRAAELAVINSIQQGIAGSLDFQGIVDLVGDKLREVLRTEDLIISWHEPDSGLLRIMYTFEHGQRLQLPARRPSPGGPWETVAASRRALVFNTAAEGAHVGVIPGTDQSKSCAYVPIIGSDRVLGLVQLENYEREHAYGESEIRLLSTVASSMGVALQSARLFDETQRLLKETDARAAELAVINGVQQGLANKLDEQAIHELVGDKLRELFDSQSISIAGLDGERDLRHYHYLHERGQRLLVPDAPISALGWHLVRSAQPLLINHDLDGQLAALGVRSQTLPGTEKTRSLLRVPILAEGRVIGAIGLDNMDREHAFDDADVRLLTTLAGSMSVALEGARLFQETQTLLAQTEQRASELATINTLGQALSSKIDLAELIYTVG